MFSLDACLTDYKWCSWQFYISVIRHAMFSYSMYGAGHEPTHVLLKWKNP